MIFNQPTDLDEHFRDRSAGSAVSATQATEVEVLPENHPAARGKCIFADNRMPLTL